MFLKFSFLIILHSYRSISGSVLTEDKFMEKHESHKDDTDMEIDNCYKRSPKKIQSKAIMIPLSLKKFGKIIHIFDNASFLSHNL